MIGPDNSPVNYPVSCIAEFTNEDGRDINLTFLSPIFLSSNQNDQGNILLTTKQKGRFILTCRIEVNKSEKVALNRIVVYK